MSRFEVNPDDEFHVLLNGSSVALSLDALAEAYEADTITESTLIWQPGFPQWLPLASVLAELDAPGTAASMAPLLPDTLQVLVDGQESQQMNLHSLRDAVRLGVVPPHARAWQPGFSEWVPVGQLVGMGSAAAAPLEAPVPAGFAASRPPLRNDGPNAPAQNSRPPLRTDGPSAPPTQPADPQLTSALQAASMRPPLRVDGPSQAPAPVALGAYHSSFPTTPSMPAPPSARAAGPSLAPTGFGSMAPPAPSGRPPLRTDGPSRAPAPLSGAPAMATNAAQVSYPPPSLAGRGVEASMPSGYASAPAASLAPVAMGSLPSPAGDDEPVRFGKRNPWPLRGLGLVAAAVVAFGLYRNGVGAEALGTHAAAQADVGTPQGMNSWLKSVDSKYGLDGVAAPSNESGTSGAAAAKDSAGKDSGALSLTPLPKDEPSSASSEASTPATAFGNLLSGKKDKPQAASAASKSKAKVSAPAKATKKAKASSSSGSGQDAYDPMNGTL